MRTPFQFKDKAAQERNQAGHDRERLLLESYKRGEGELGVEIKFDRERDETGNWFIEFEGNKGQPSGIETTKCLFWESSSYFDVLRVPVVVLEKYITEFTDHENNKYGGRKGVLDSRRTFSSVESSKNQQSPRKTHYEYRGRKRMNICSFCGKTSEEDRPSRGGKRFWHITCINAHNKKIHTQNSLRLKVLKGIGAEHLNPRRDNAWGHDYALAIPMPELTRALDYAAEILQLGAPTLRTIKIRGGGRLSLLDRVMVQEDLVNTFHLVLLNKKQREISTTPGLRPRKFRKPEPYFYNVITAEYQGSYVVKLGVSGFGDTIRPESYLVGNPFMVSDIMKCVRPDACEVLEDLWINTVRFAFPEFKKKREGFLVPPDMIEEFRQKAMEIAQSLPRLESFDETSSIHQS